MEEMMATTTRSRPAGAAKRTPRAKAAPASPTALRRAASVRDDATAAVRSLGRRTRSAVRSVPVNGKTISIAVTAIATVTAAGVALFLGRDRIAKAAAVSREKLRQAADDISIVAHEQIDKARDNITKLRTQKSETATSELPMTVAL
jgi:hypothetical protein